MARSDRESLVGVVRARLPELTTTAVAAVRVEVPAYRDLAGEQLRDVEAIAGWTVRRVLQCWQDGTGLDEDDRRRFRAIGAARAADGRPVAAVLRAYRVAAVAAVGRVREVGRGRLDVDDVADLTTVLLTALDELSEALLTGHAAGREQLGDDRDRSLRGLLDDLLVGRQSSSGALADRTRELGLVLPRHPVLLLAEPGPAPAGVDAEPLLGALRTAGGTLVGRHGPRVVLLGAPEVLRPAGDVVAGHRWRGCAVTGPLVGVSGLHRLATHALDTAPPHAFTTRTLLDEGDARVLGLLGAHPGADPEAVVRTVLGPLTDDGQEHVLAGLRAFVTAGSASAAATALHVHPQTLRYRLRRARELTGRDPADPWQHLVLAVALQVLRAQP